MKSKRAYNPPSFPIMEAATQGDVTAINAVLRHYERYIISLSLRPVFDMDGGLRLAIDPDIKRRLETKLITKILDFEIA